MIDYNFTDDKIIKALECCEKGCACTSCPLEDDYSPCSSSMAHLALSLINKQNAEMETLKDNNEHLAVMLEETKIELKAMRGAANSYKMHYEKAIEVQKEVYRLASEIKAELPLANAELAKNVASEIFAEIESLIDGKFSINHGVVLMSKEDFAELKKKYIGEKENDR